MAGRRSRMPPHLGHRRRAPLDPELRAQLLLGRPPVRSRCGPGRQLRQRLLAAACCARPECRSRSTSTGSNGSGASGAVSARPCSGVAPRHRPVARIGWSATRRRSPTSGSSASESARPTSRTAPRWSPTTPTTSCDGCGIEPGSYVLTVARLVPENNVRLAIEGVDALDPATRPLHVIVGSADDGDELVEYVRGLDRTRDDLRWLGHVDDQRLLSQLFRHSSSTSTAIPSAARTPPCCRRWAPAHQCSPTTSHSIAR